MRIDVVNAAVPLVSNTALGSTPGVNPAQNTGTAIEAANLVGATSVTQQVRSAALEAQKQQELREQQDFTPTIEDIEKLISRGNSLFDELRLNEHFQLRRHDKLPATMIRLVDIQRDRVIREFPPKNYLDLVAALQELTGLMFDKRV